MAPIADPVAPAPMTRARTRPRRHEPVPLEQLPAWHELVPVMDPAADRRAGARAWTRCSVASTRTSDAR